MNRQQLERFILIRNRSEFDSNLQFGIDADEAGFDVRELGTPEKLGKPGETFYRWTTPHGLLNEVGGKLTLIDADTGNQLFPGVIDVGFRKD